MSVRRIMVTLCLGSLVSCLGACQKTQDAASGSGGPAAESPVQQRTPTVELSDYLPVLDDGRVEIAPPAGWNVLPRGGSHLTRFYKNNRNGLPRIEVKVEDRRYGDISTVTTDNVGKFAERVAAELEERGKRLLEPVIPMVLGEVPCARYVTLLQLTMGEKTISAERQHLLVLHGGRLYTIDLSVLPATLKQSRDAAYAICSGLRFVAGD
ncbi:MAG: hypothetical protein ACC628_05565 [Pirellulaceae bacterium]